MKYFVVYMVILNISIISIFCQPNFSPEKTKSSIQSLLQKLATDIKPRKRIAFQLKLVSLYEYSHEDVDSLINSSLKIAEKNDFNFFIAKSLKTRARYRLYINEKNELILNDIARIDSISQFFKNKFLPRWVNSLSAQYYLDNGELDKAEVYMKRFSNFIRENEKFDGGSYNTMMGMLYHKKRAYTKAMKEYGFALKRDNPGKIFIYNNIAKLQLELHNPTLALLYVDKSIEISKDFNSKIAIIESYIIKGDAYLFQKDTSKAIEYYEKAEITRNIPFYSKNFSAIDRLASIYSVTNTEKVDSLLSDLSLYNKVETYSILLVQKGDRMLDKGNISEAEKLCHYGLKEAKKRLKYSYAAAACDCLIEINKYKNKYVVVSDLLQEKIAFWEKINDDNQIVTIARNLAKFETIKEKETLQQNFEKTQAVLKEKINRYKLTAIFIGLFLSVVLFFLYQLKKRNSKIKDQNKTISKALKDKDILLREIHHRVKNNLQLVSSLLTLQGRSLDNEVAVQAINDGKNRVRSMALIHQDLYNKENLTEIGVQHYLNKLVKELFNTYNVDEERIRLVLDIDNIDIDIDTLVPLGLILNELITNSLKYAFPNRNDGELSIIIQNRNENIVLIVQDNGVGYNSEIISSTSFGSTLVSALTAQLEGEMIIQSDNNGTKNILTIKTDI